MKCKCSHYASRHDLDGKCHVPGCGCIVFRKEDEASKTG